MKSTLCVLILIFLTLINFVFTLDPNPALHAALETLINPEGIQTVSTIAYIDQDDHGLVIISPSKPEDFSYYTIGNFTAECDIEWNDDQDPPEIHHSGTCQAHEPVSFLIQCSIPKNVDDQDNFIYINFDQENGTKFYCYGDSKASFVPRDFKPDFTQEEQNSNRNPLSLDIPWSDYGQLDDINSVVVIFCPVT